MGVFFGIVLESLAGSRVATLHCKKNRQDIVSEETSPDWLDREIKKCSIIIYSSRKEIEKKLVRSLTWVVAIQSTKGLVMSLPGIAFGHHAMEIPNNIRGDLVDEQAS